MNRNQKSEVSGRKSAQNLLSLLAVAVALVCWEPSASSQTNSTPARLSYDSFRTISDRNIFNPSRSVRRSGAPRTASQPASRIESFSLVGIMAYEKGWFAFFDGTKGDYKQTLQQDGAIGEYKVMHITPDLVKLAAGTNTFDLKVGMQMRREDEGDWFLSEGGETPRRRVISTRTRTRGGSRNGESSTNGAADEMISGGEPEIIVVESGAPTETTEAETPVPNGNGNTNGEAVREEAGADNGGVTDPVLLRLMQRRQQMNQ